MTDLDEFRADKDEFFRSDQSSPLTPEQRAEFRGLRYYPERPDLVFTMSLEPFDHAETIEMQTSTGHTAWYTRAARIRFEVSGEPAELTVYRDPTMGLLFLPFQDGNAGGDTYGAGRYLEPQLLEDGRLLVDFNYAYNPYCAYNERWTCPIPPAENRLTVAIEAGEMSWDEAH